MDLETPSNSALLFLQQLFDILQHVYIFSTGKLRLRINWRRLGELPEKINLDGHKRIQTRARTQYTHTHTHIERIVANSSITKGTRTPRPQYRTAARST